ncbi:hypothetical protein OESDEN_02329 [Oesophagostomum dentatum]|uniref:Uncharacterized protein n=1 Tax=Oesophagostomum dentatum TaxID=61180 RepID=A0A0B1TQP3_OESDE|nr:hypothetical protein OESDEN_02329 [Oesophagostomum dentatum]
MDRCPTYITETYTFPIWLPWHPINVAAKSHARYRKQRKITVLRDLLIASMVISL